MKPTRSSTLTNYMPRSGELRHIDETFPVRIGAVLVERMTTLRFLNLCRRPCFSVNCRLGPYRRRSQDQRRAITDFYWRWTSMLYSCRPTRRRAGRFSRERGAYANQLFTHSEKDRSRRAGAKKSVFGADGTLLPIGVNSFLPSMRIRSSTKGNQI